MLEEVKTIHKRHPHHWRYLRKRRLYSENVSTKQIVAGQIFTIIVSIFGGLILDDYKFQIIAFTGALILYPGLIDLCSSIGGALGAKLNHHLDKTPYRVHSILIADISFSILITVSAAVILGVTGSFIGSFFLDVNYLKLISLAVLTTASVSLIFYPAVAGFVLLLRKKGLNPDNLVGPVESSVIDIMVTASIVISIGILS